MLFLYRFKIQYKIKVNNINIVFEKVILEANNLSWKIIKI